MALLLHPLRRPLKYSHCPGDTHTHTHTTFAGHASRIPPKKTPISLPYLCVLAPPLSLSRHTHSLLCQTHREALVCEDGLCVFALRACVCRQTRREPRRAGRTAAQGGVTDLQRGGRPAGEPAGFDFTLIFIAALLRALRVNAPPKNEKESELENSSVSIQPAEEF